MTVLSSFAEDLPLIAAVLVATLIIFSMAVLFIDVPQQLRDPLRDEVKRMESMVSNNSLEGIIVAVFSNNAQVNAMLATPILNTFVYPMMIFSTAWALRMSIENQVVNASGVNIFTALVQSLATLFMLPHTYVEFLSYSITFVASSKLMISLFKRSVDREKAKHYLFSIAISMAILFVAALIEGLEIAFFAGATS